MVNEVSSDLPPSQCVIVIIDGVEYESIKEASRQTGIPASTIHNRRLNNSKDGINISGHKVQGKLSIIIDGVVYESNYRCVKKNRNTIFNYSRKS